MAIWQCKFRLVPQSVLELMDINNLDLENVESLILHEKIKSSLFAPFQNILMIGKSWSDNIVIYGKEDSNCIEISCDDEYVYEISWRLDFTSERARLIINEVVEFCIQNGFQLINEDLNIVNLNSDIVSAEIKSSQAYNHWLWNIS